MLTLTKKYFLITGFVLCHALPALCQYPSFSKADSVKINELKNILPVLTGRERVDALNQLCELFESYYRVGGIKPKKESINSIYHYAGEANKEAAQLGYTYGIAGSLFHLTMAYGDRVSPDLQTKDSTGKRYLQQVAILGEYL